MALQGSVRAPFGRDREIRSLYRWESKFTFRVARWEAVLTILNRGRNAWCAGPSRRFGALSAGVLRLSV